MDDADHDPTESADPHHVGVIIPSPPERETLSADRRAAILAHNRSVRERSEQRRETADL